MFVPTTTLTQGIGTPLNGWVDDSANAWTRTADQTFTVTGDRTAVFSKGTRLKWTQTTVKYGVVVLSSHAAGTTTVTIATTTDYVLTAAAISANYYSYAASPEGFPGWFNYSPTYTGFSADPSGGVCRWSITGTICHVKHLRSDGTSNATDFTFTLPVAGLNTAGPVASMNFNGRIKNSGAIPATYGMLDLTDTATASVFRDATGLAWTGSGAKNAYLAFWYEF